METVDNKSIPLWQQPSAQLQDQVLVSIPRQVSSFRNELDELEYMVKNVGSGRKISVIEDIMKGVL